MAVTKIDYVEIMAQSNRFVPYWARSTNPIVRRHLGLNWRTVPPEIRPFVVMVGVWAGLLLLGLALPFVLDLTLMVFLGSLMAMPVAAGVYAHVLTSVAITTTQTMQQEMSNNTFQLLQATPMTLEQIFLGKVAASLWRRMDDLVLALQLNAMFAAPFLFAIFSGVYDYQTNSALVVVLVIAGLIASLVRMVLEPVMLGMLAVMIGLLVPARNLSVTATIVFGVFYVVIFNLFANLPTIAGHPVWTIITMLIAPIVLPLLISGGCLWLAHRVVTED